MKQDKLQEKTHSTPFVTGFQIKHYPLTPTLMSLMNNFLDG